MNLRFLYVAALAGAVAGLCACTKTTGGATAGGRGNSWTQPHVLAVCRCRRRQHAQPASGTVHRHRLSVVDDAGVPHQVGRAQPAVSGARDGGSDAGQRRRQQRRTDDHLPHSQGREVVGRGAVRRRRRRLLDQGRAQSGQQRGRPARLGSDHEDRRARQVHGRLSHEEAVLAVRRDVLFDGRREPGHPAQAPARAVSEHQSRSVQLAADRHRTVQVRALGPRAADRPRSQSALLARPTQAQRDHL